MGYRVSGLAHVPTNPDDWHLYVAGTFNSDEDAWLNNNFNKLARDIGPSGVIVAGHDADVFTGALIRFFEKYRMKPNQSEPLEDELHKMAFAVVSKGDLLSTRQPAYFVPLSLGVAPVAEATEFMSAIIGKIVDAIASGQVPVLMRKLGATEYKLKDGSNAFLATLRNLNEVLLLEPNIIGIGINLNKAIEKLLGNPVREVPG
jgi:hypothetical protein